MLPKSIEPTCGSDGADCNCGEMIRMLSEENANLRKAGARLAAAAIHVSAEYDGLHRLMLATSEWTKAMADEHGRGERYAADRRQELDKRMEDEITAMDWSGKHDEGDE